MGGSTRASALVISTAPGVGYGLTSAEDGVAFDLDADGVLEQVPWTNPAEDSAFLAIDVDGNGAITSAAELIGDRTVAGLRNATAALAHLARASNGGIQRGSVSTDDPIFAKLLLWTDRNHNGVSEPSELRPASEVLAAIGLGYIRTSRVDQNGNAYRFEGWVHVRTAPGRNSTQSAAEDRIRTRRTWEVVLVAQR